MNAILVVDDDQMFRTVMKHHLQGMGFSVLENDSGVGVIEQIARHQPAACLIDILMDKKEGLETIEEISGLPDRPKVIAVSSDALYLNIAKEFGIDAALQKPIALETLRKTFEGLGIKAK
jgi:CheY-like chemotaxis protein